MKVADEVRSPKLAEALSVVVNKIEDALESRISKAVHNIGLPLARRFGLLAQKWGNPRAEKWISDISFARFLAIMHLNKPNMPIESP
jgi:hypothetical protein